MNDLVEQIMWKMTWSFKWQTTDLSFSDLILLTLIAYDLQSWQLKWVHNVLKW